MLFNSYAFILGFLPVALLLFHGLRRAGLARSSIGLLALLSLVFYGWWNPIYLLLIVPLMLVNFALAACIVPQDGRRPRGAKLLLVLGILLNLTALGYFKYANFFVDNLNAVGGLHLLLGRVVLPIGISFFTFQKIAFLVDAYRDRIDRLNFIDYVLFVTFFPQLIAGPIVHHSEVMRQFRDRAPVAGHTIALGVTIFTIGLAKKVLLADTAALYASPLFDAVAAGARPNALAAWGSALAYTAQLYFDFSGYSDMAIGGGLLFGIRLPVNFASPYKADSIIDFWHRWHITLSRFLREYLYVPLGGNRKGQSRRYVNLMITMLLGGFWHGAGWTFVVWGALHGLYLVVNHLWRALRGHLDGGPGTSTALGRHLGQGITFVAVVVAWVFFRSEDMGTAVRMLRAMAGSNGLGLPASMANLWLGLPGARGPVDSAAALLVSAGLLAIAWFAPNTQELTGYVGPEGAQAAQQAHRPPAVRWQPSAGWAVAVGCLFGIALMLLSKVSEFIYFQF
jgi:D-alanyl-lipoteichoic acid acyltransferase DltB (MBOAT superfamily)